MKDKEKERIKQLKEWIREMKEYTARFEKR